MSEGTHQIVVQQRPSLLLDPSRFEHAQRASKALGLSALFPDHLKGRNQEDAIATALTVMNIADRLNEDPMAVAQNIHIIKGKPGWDSRYMIARLNQSGMIKGRMRFEIEEDKDNPIEVVKVQYRNISATAIVVPKGETEPIRETVTMDMAVADGWVKNEKYKTIPERMLRYRAASALISIYFNEVMLGIGSTEDAVDYSAPIDVTPPRPNPADYAGAAKGDRFHGTDGDITDIKPEEVTEGDSQSAEETEKAEAPSEKATPADEDPEHEELGGYTVEGFKEMFLGLLDECNDELNVVQIKEQYGDEIAFLPAEIQAELQNAMSETRRGFRK